MTLLSIDQYPSAGVAGQLIGGPSYNKLKSMLNRQANVAAVYTATITAVNSTVYTVSINGIPITFTSDASATTAEIADGLVAAIAANQFTNALVSAANVSNTLVITERDPSLGAITVVESDANLAMVTTTAHSNESVILPGFAVVRATGADKACMLPTGASQQFEGVAVFAQVPAYDERVGALSQAQYVSGQYLPVLHSGVILVPTEVAVAPGDSVFFRHAVNGAQTRLGMFRNTNDGGNATQVTNARWRSSTVNGLAELAIDIP